MWKSIKLAFTSCIQTSKETVSEPNEQPKRSFKNRLISFFKRNKKTTAIPEESPPTQSIEDGQVSWVFDIGWAVGAKPEGDLAQVLASKNAHVLKVNYVAIGPYVNAQGITIAHLPADSPITISVQKLRAEGHRVAAVQWNIPCSPPVILFDLGSQADRIQLFKQLVFQFLIHFNCEMKRKTIETGIEHSANILGS